MTCTVPPAWSQQNGNVLPFQDAAPTPAGDWRHIVRFGRNVASYKFALGQALLDLAARQQTFVSVAELAVPYAAGLCQHLQTEDRQSTSAQSQFLDAGESLITSHHPLRETLISQLGPDPGIRLQTLTRRYRAAMEMMRHSWIPPVKIGC
jgi:hypothetical protein